MRKRTVILCLFAVILPLVAACGPAATPEPTTPRPPAEPPTVLPAAPSDTPRSEPTMTPVVTRGWSTTASTGTELSFRHPGDWFGPSKLPFGEGIYVKDPDRDIGVIFVLELSGSPETLLASFGSKEVGVIGLLSLTPQSVTDGDPVTVSGIEADTRIAHGDDLIARAAFIQRQRDVMEIILFAPTAQWEVMQQVFSDILESVEIYRKYTSRGLHTMYLHDWGEPSAPPSGEGLWFRSADEKTGILLWTGAIADPVQLLSQWSPDRLAEIGASNCTTPEPGDRVRALSADWESRTGGCQDASGGPMTFEVAFVGDRDRVLEVVTYAPAHQWEAANEVIETTLGLLTDIR